MKRNFLGVVLMSLAALFACSEQDQELGASGNGTQSVKFEVDVMDLTTKCDGCDEEVQEEDEDMCLNHEQLKTAAQAGELEARFKITNNADADEEIVRKIRYSQDGRFIADPYDIQKKGGPWKLTYFTVWQNSVDGEDMLYSGVSSKEDSEFASYMDEKQLLPQSISIEAEDMYNKTTHPVTVICTNDMDPVDFGYKMWDLNFIKFQKVPFMVNVCGDDKVHSVLSGKIEQYKDANTEDDKYTPGELLKTIYFNAGEANKLILVNYINVDDSKEFYLHKLYMLTTDNGDNGADENDEYEILSSTANSVGTIFDYKRSSAWMDDLNMLDINLCNVEEKQFWIFD